jgi:hypothetical protein
MPAFLAVAGAAGGEPPPPYSPADEPDIVAWFDPTSGVTMDGSNRVSFWESRVNGHAVAQLSSPSQPLFEAAGLLGQAALYFDGARYLSTLTAALANSLDGAQPHTMVAVIDRNVAATNNAICTLGDSASSTNVQIWGTATGTGIDSVYRQGVGSVNVLGTLMPGTSPARMMMSYTPGNVSLWVNDVASASVAATVANTCDRVVIGAYRYSGAYANLMTGRIADILILNTARSIASLANLLAYLDAKYPGL